MHLTLVIGNNFWIFRDDTMMETEWKGCDRRTDRRPDGQADRMNHYTAVLSQLKKNTPFLAKMGTSVEGRFGWEWEDRAMVNIIQYSPTIMRSIFVQVLKTETP